MGYRQHASEMLSRTIFVSIWLLIAQLMVSSTLATRVLLQSSPRNVVADQITHGNVLFDYIGGSGGSIQLTDVPIEPRVNYIFALSSAIDADVDGNTQNGVFSPSWASSISPEAAARIVKGNHNIKLVASLAGSPQKSSAARDTQLLDSWYDPSDTHAWINNAVKSIASLVQQYSLSGIDINYGNFPASSTFTECIGGLISQLKNSGTISVVSIATFENTLPYYQDLFSKDGDFIDYVNYQIYADGLSSQSEYVFGFKKAGSYFDPSKMMMGVEVGQGGTPGRGLTGSAFMSAAQQVSIAGIMVFNADNSQSQGFSAESLASSYLSS